MMERQKVSISQPWQADQKLELTNRARAIRDADLASQISWVAV